MTTTAHLKTVPTSAPTKTPEEVQHIAGNPDGACLEDLIALIEYIDHASGDDWTDTHDARRIREYCDQAASAREHRLVGNIQLPFATFSNQFKQHLVALTGKKSRCTQ